MKITKIQSTPNFKANQLQTSNKKDEFIDKMLKKVKNPSDINDTVNVPRGIFKAYICLMSGTGLSSIAGLLPKKAAIVKTPLSIIGALLGILSAFYFAKPFIIKDSVNNQETKEIK